MKRFICSTLSVIVMCTNVLFAHSIESSFWGERRIARGMELTALPPVALPAPSRGTHNNLRDLLQRLSPSVGRVAEKSSLPNFDRPTVIHIQDVHSSVEAQRNIGRLVEMLVRDGGVKVVALEGASGALNLQPLTLLSPATRAQVAEQFLSAGDIGGPLNLALTNPDLNARFVGVDDANLFKNNWAAVKNISSTAVALRAILKDRAQKLETAKAAVLNPELHAFDRNVQAYRAGTMQVSDYIHYLTQQAGASSPTLRLFEQASAAEKNLSSPAMGRQREEFIQRVLIGLTPSDRQQLAANAQAHKAGRMRTNEFFSSLLAFASKAGYSSIPAHVRHYVLYATATERLDATTLMAEIRIAEENRYRDLIRTPAEKALIEKSERLYFANKTSEFSLTPAEWEAYRRGSQAVNEMGRFKAPFEKFYEIASKRDGALARNTAEVLAKSGNRVIVLVTGGFHSNGVQSALRASGIDVVSVSPHLSLLDAVASGDSLLAIVNKKWAFAGLFPEGNQFLTQPVLSPGVYQRLANYGLAHQLLTGERAGFSAMAARVLAPISGRVLALWKSGRNSFLVVAEGNGVSVVHGTQANNEVRVASRSLLRNAAVIEEMAIHAGVVTRRDWWNAHYTGGVNWVALGSLTVAILTAKAVINALFVWNTNLRRTLSLQAATALHTAYNTLWNYALAPIEINAKTFLMFFNGFVEPPTVIANLINYAINSPWFTPAVDLTIRERHEWKWPVWEGDPAVAGTWELLFTNGLGWDPFYALYAATHPRGTLNSNYYLDVPGIYTLGAEREISQHNSLRVRLRVREYFLHPYDRNPQPNDVLKFEIKVLQGTGRTKPGFSIRRHNAWKVLHGITDRNLLVDPTDKREWLAYNFWTKLQKEMGLLPVVNITYGRRSGQSRVVPKLTPAEKPWLRFSQDFDSRARMITPQDLDRLMSPGSDHTVDPRGHHLIYRDSHFPGQDIVIIEGKYPGPYPPILARMVNEFRLKIGATSKFTDALNYFLRWKPSTFVYNEENSYDAFARQNPRVIPAKAESVVVPAGVDRSAFDGWSDEGERAAESAFSNGVYRLFRTAMLAVFISLIFTGSSMAQSVDAGSVAEMLLNPSGGVATGMSLWWTCLRGVCLSFVCCALLIGGYLKFFRTKNFEEEFPIAILILTPIITVMTVYLQITYLLGLPLLGLLGGVRSRFGERSRKDQVVYASSSMIGFMAGTSHPEFAVLVTFIVIGALWADYQYGIGRAKTFNYHVVIEIANTEKARSELAAVLRNHVARQEQYHERVNTETNTYIWTNRLDLKDPNGTSPNGGRDGFLRALLAIEGAQNPEVQPLGNGGNLYSIAWPLLIPMLFAQTGSLEFGPIEKMLTLGLVAAALAWAVTTLWLKNTSQREEPAMPDYSNVADPAEAQRLALIYGPVEMPFHARAKSFLAKASLPFIVSVMALIGGYAYFQEDPLRNNPRAFYAEVRPVEAARVNAPAEGKLVGVTVRDGDHVEKGAVIGYVEVKGTRIQEAEKNKLISDLRLKEAEVLAEIERYRANFSGVLIDQLQTMHALVSDTFGVRVQRIELAANRSNLEFEKRFLAGFEKLRDRRSASEWEVRLTQQKVQELTRRVEQGQALIEKTEASIVQMESDLAGLVSRSQNNQTQGIQKYLQVLKSLKQAEDADLALLETKYRPEPIVAPISGTIARAPMVSLTNTPAYQEVTRIISSETPREAKALIDPRSPIPSVGDVVYLENRNGVGAPVRAVVLRVANYISALPADEQSDLLEDTGVNANRRQRQFSGIPREGVPVYIRILDANHSLRSYQDVLVRPSRTGEKFPLENLEPQKAQNLGEIEGKSVVLEEVGRTVFGPSELKQISGAVEYQGRFLIGDDSGRIVAMTINPETQALTYDETIDLTGLSNDPDLEALMVAPNNRVGVLFERPAQLHLLKLEKGERALQRKDAVVVSLPATLSSVEGAAFHPETGHLFVAQTKASVNFVYELIVDEQKGTAQIIRQFEAKEIPGPIRDIRFRRMADGRFALALLEAGDAPKIRVMRVDGEKKGHLYPFHVDLRGLGLKKAEAIGEISEGRWFVGSETKELGKDANTHAILRLGDINERSGPVVPMHSVMPAMLLFSQPSSAMTWALAVGLLAFVAVKFVMNKRANSLSRVLRQLNDGRLLVMTVNDETMTADLARLEAVQKRVAADPTLATVRDNILVVYLGQESTVPASVFEKAGGATVIKGPESEGGVYHMDSIFELAEVAVSDQQGTLRDLVRALANPRSNAGQFAILTVQPAQLFIPPHLATRAWEIAQILGFWNLTPYSIEDRIATEQMAAIQA